MSSNTVLFSYIIGTLGFIVLVTVLIAMVYIQINRKNLYAAGIKEQEYQFKNELQNSRIEIQEHLLNEVSREIHDNVGQVLSLEKVHLFTIGNLVASEKAAELVETSKGLLDKAIEDLRNISHTQNAGVVQQIGLEETLRKELKYIAALKNLDCEFEIMGLPVPMTQAMQLLVYRIAQEAIHNSIKHAKATLLQVYFNYGPNRFSVTIKDNGNGFDVSGDAIGTGAAIGVGLGLQHMKHRAKVLKGDLEIISAPMQGTTVLLTIPI